MSIFQVMLNGKVTLTIPGEIRDGFLWGLTGDSAKPVLNGSLLAENGVSQDEAKKALASGKYSDKIRACFMTVGDNANGRTVVNKTAADRLEHEQWKANRTPADLRREEIATLWAKVRRCDRSEDDVEYDRLRFAAQDAESKFYAEFPEELKKDQAAELRAKADKARELASGALVYDADGWISSEEQERRAAEFRAEAAQYDLQADELSK
jgi:hypothetical protein